MIQAIVFDLDGVVVQSEKLKAQAYAMAVQQLRGLSEPDPQAVEAYRAIVGASREVATQFVVDQLGLEPDLAPLMEKYGVSQPWQVLTEMRAAIYNEMVADPQVLRDNQWPHTVGLLRLAKESGCLTGLATSSLRDMTLHALRALDIERSLDLVLTREDVENPKPDPEIYLLAAQKFELPPEEMLVVEDSPNGVRAAVAAGMNVIAFATPFTVKGLHESKVLDHKWILHESDKLLDMAQRVIREHERNVHGEKDPQETRLGIPPATEEDQPDAG